MGTLSPRKSLDDHRSTMRLAKDPVNAKLLFSIAARKAADNKDRSMSRIADIFFQRMCTSRQHYAQWLPQSKMQELSGAINTMELAIHDPTIYRSIAEAAKLEGVRDFEVFFATLIYKAYVRGARICENDPILSKMAQKIADQHRLTRFQRIVASLQRDSRP